MRHSKYLELRRAICVHGGESIRVRNGHQISESAFTVTECVVNKF